LRAFDKRLLRHRLAFALIGTLLLFIFALLPFTVASVVDELLGPPEGRIFYVPGPSVAAAPTHTRLHVAMAALDDFQQLATLRVSGHHYCETRCEWNDRVVFFAISPLEEAPEGLPPSAAITLPADIAAVTETFQLPARGHPTRYPFDTYDLWLGVVLQRVLPDGAVQTLTPEQARGHLFLSFQEQVPRQTMQPPRQVDPASVRPPNAPFDYLYVDVLTLVRPLWLRILAIMLVLLVAAAASYAVFMRPLHELVINAGALVLGVWGIRQILTNANYAGLTAVDLSLSVVILFLLSAITVRALLFAHDLAELHWLRHRAKMEHASEAPPSEHSSDRDPTAK
jgi:ABC-type multidrug transport system fused ATPase/permease subunit